MLGLPAVRVVTVRVGGKQLPLLPSADAPIRSSSVAILDARLRGTKFIQLGANRVLNAPQSTGMDFWSLNPYVGCEFGCTYCYARFTHRYVVERAHDAGKLSDAELAEFRGRHGWEAFETRVFVKQHILGALDADLKRYARVALPPRTAAPEPIVIGTATDPYQPGERRFGVTRAVLQRLAQCEGLSIGLITKSPLVARDIDLLQRIQEHNDLEVHVSLVALEPALIRALEARSPMPAVRLRALRRLTAAGVNAGLIVAPVLPGISDDWARLDALFAAARAAGARFIHASPLRLYPAIRDRFLPVLASRYPELIERYRRAYTGRGAAPPQYARALSRRIQRLQVKHGFAVRGMRDRYEKQRPSYQWDLGL